jgi:hypothetical protein
MVEAMSASHINRLFLVVGCRFSIFLIPIFANISPPLMFIRYFCFGMYIKLNVFPEMSNRGLVGQTSA